MKNNSNQRTNGTARQPERSGDSPGYFPPSKPGQTGEASPKGQRGSADQYNHENAVADGGKGNDFCQKITYRTGFVRIVEKKPQPDGSELEEITWKRASSLSPDEILSAFRNSYNPHIAVTVDMIATGTDITAPRLNAVSKRGTYSQSPAESRDNPLEIVFFMRSVASKIFFVQKKGRGVRVVSHTKPTGGRDGLAKQKSNIACDTFLLGLPLCIITKALSL